MARPPRLNNSGLPLYHLTRVGPPASLPQVPDTMDLYRVTTVIGRNATQADFVLDSTNRIRSAYISRLHARIIREGEIHRLRDDSLNGVFINHIKIAGSCILQEGDLVTFGHPNGSNILVGTFKRQSDSEYKFLFTRCDCELQTDPPAPTDTENKFKTPAVDTKHGDGPERGGQDGMSSTTSSQTPILPQPDSGQTDDADKSNTSINAEKDESKSSKKKSTDLSPGKSADVSKSKPSNMESATAVIHPYQSSSKSYQISDTVEKCSARNAPGGVDDSKYVVKDSLDASQESDLNREYLESESVDYQGEASDIDFRNEDNGRNAGTDTEVSVPPSTGSRTDDEGHSDACLTDEAAVEVIVISSESESEEMDQGSETLPRERMKCIEICGISESPESVIGRAFKHEPCEPSPVFKKPKLFPEDSKGSDNDKTSPVFSTVVCKPKPPKSQHLNSKSSTKPRKKSTKSWCFSSPIAVAPPTYKLSDSSQESSQSSEDEAVPSLDLFDSESVESTPGSADDGMKIHQSDKNSSAIGNKEKHATSLSQNTTSGGSEDKASVIEVQDSQSPHLNSNQSNIFTPDLFKSNESADIDSEDIVGFGHSDKACATSQLSSSQQSEGITEYEEDAEQHVSTEFIQQVIHHAKQELGKIEEKPKSEPLQKEPSITTKESGMLPEDNVISEVPDLTEGVPDCMQGQAGEKSDILKQDEDVIEQCSIECVKVQLTDHHVACENVDQLDQPKEDPINQELDRQESVNVMGVNRQQLGEVGVKYVSDQQKSTEVMELNQKQPDEVAVKHVSDQQESFEVMELNQHQPDEVALKHVSDQQESVEVMEVNQQPVEVFVKHVSDQHESDEVMELKQQQPDEVFVKHVSDQHELVEVVKLKQQPDEVAVKHASDQQESVEVMELKQQQPAEVAVKHVSNQQESVEVMELKQQQPAEVAVKHVSNQQESVEVMELKQQQPDEVAVKHLSDQQKSVEEIMKSDRQGLDEDVMGQAIDQQEPFKDAIDHVKEQTLDDKDNVQVVMTQLLDQLELVEDKEANDELGSVDAVIEEPTDDQEQIQDVTQYVTDQLDVMENEVIDEHQSDHEEFNENAMEQVVHEQQQADDDTTHQRNLQGTFDDVTVQESFQAVTRQVMDEEEPSSKIMEQATDQQESFEDVMKKALVEQAPVDVIEEDPSNNPEPIHDVTEYVTDQQEAVKDVMEQGSVEAISEHQSEHEEFSENAMEQVIDQQQQAEDYVALERNLEGAVHDVTVQESFQAVTRQVMDEEEPSSKIMEQVTDQQESFEDVMKKALVEQAPVDFIEEDPSNNPEPIHDVTEYVTDQQEAVKDVMEQGSVEAISEHQSEHEEFSENAMEQVIDQQQQAEDDVELERNLEGAVHDVTVQESFQAVSDQVMDEQEPSSKITEQVTDQQESFEDVMKKALVEQAPVDVIEEDPSNNPEPIHDVTEYVTDQQEAVKDVMEQGSVEAISEHQSEHEEFSENAMEQVIDQQQQAEDDVELERNLEGAVHDVTVQESFQAVTRQVMDEQEPSSKITEQATDQQESFEDVMKKALVEQAPVDVIEENHSDNLEPIHDVTEYVTNPQEAVKEVMELGPAEEVNENELVINQQQQAEDDVTHERNLQGTVDDVTVQESFQAVTRQVMDEEEPSSKITEQATDQQESFEDVMKKALVEQAPVDVIEEDPSNNPEPIHDVTEYVTDQQEAVKDVIEQGSVEAISEHQSEHEEFSENAMEQVIDQQQQAEDYVALERNLEGAVHDVTVQESFQAVSDQVMDEQEPSSKITEQVTDQQESFEDVMKKALVEQAPVDVIEENHSDNLEPIHDVTEYVTNPQEAVKEVMELGPAEEVNENELVINQQQQAEDDVTHERNLQGTVDDVTVQESFQAVTRQVMDEEEPSSKITEQATDQQESFEDVMKKALVEQAPVDVIEEDPSNNPEPIHDVTEYVTDQQEAVKDVMEQGSVEAFSEHQSEHEEFSENAMEQVIDQQQQAEDDVALERNLEGAVHDVTVQESFQAVSDQVMDEQEPSSKITEQATDQQESFEDIMKKALVKQAPVDVIEEDPSDNPELIYDIRELTEVKEVMVLDQHESVAGDMKQVTDQDYQSETITEQGSDQLKSVGDVQTQDLDQQELVQDVTEQVIDQQGPIETLMEEAPIQHETCDVTVRDSDQQEVFEDFTEQVKDNHGQVEDLFAQDLDNQEHVQDVMKPEADRQESVEDISEQEKYPQEPINNVLVQESETTKLVTIEAPVVPSDSELKLITSIDECIAETMPMCPHDKEPVAGQAETSERTDSIILDYNSELLAANQEKKQLKDGEDDVNRDPSVINEENSVPSNMPSETYLAVDESQGFCLGASPLIPLSQEEEDMLLADDSMEVPSCSSEGAVSGHITLNLVSNLLEDLVEEVVLKGKNDLKDEVTVDPCETDFGQELQENVAIVESIKVHQLSDNEARPCCSVYPNKSQATNNQHTNDSLKVNVPPPETEEDELSPIIPQQPEAVLEHQDSSVVVDSSVLEQEDDFGLTPNLHLHLSQADNLETEDILVEEEVSVVEENHDVESTQDLHLYLSQVGSEDFSGSDDNPEADVRSNKETSNDLLEESALACKSPAEANCQVLEDRCEESMATSQTTYQSFDLSQDVDESDKEQNQHAPETPSEVPFEMLNEEQTERVNVFLGKGPTSEDNTGTNLKLSNEEIDNLSTMEDSCSEDKDKFGEPHDFDHTAENVDCESLEQNKINCFNEKSIACDTNATLSTSSEDHKIASVDDTADNISNSSVQKITLFETTTTEEQLSDEELNTSFKDPKAFEHPSIPFAKNIVASTPKKSSEGNSDSASTLDSLVVQTDVSTHQKDLSQTKSERSTDDFNSEQTVFGSIINSAQSDKDVGNQNDKNPSTSDDDLTSDENCINLQLSGIESQTSDFENRSDTHESQEEKEGENSAYGKKLEDVILGDMSDKQQTMFKAPQSETDTRDKANVSEQEGDLLGSITAVKDEDKLNESEISFTDEELHLEISASDESHVKTEEPMSTSSDSESVVFVSPIIKFQGTARDIKVASERRICVNDSLNTSSESDVPLISPVIKFIGIQDSGEMSDHHGSSVSLLHSSEKGASGIDTSTSQVNLMRITSDDDVEDPTQDSFDFMKCPNDPDTCSEESDGSETELNISGVAPFELSDNEQDSVIEVKVDKLRSNIIDATNKDIEPVTDSATSESGGPNDAQTKTPERDISTKATTDGAPEPIPEVGNTTEKDFVEDTDDQMRISVDEPPGMFSPAAVGSDHEAAVKLYLSPSDREPVFTAQPLFKVDDNNVIIFDSEIRQVCIDDNEKSEIGDASQSENSLSTTIRLYSCPDETSPLFLVKPVICESTSLTVNDQTLKVDVNQSLPEDMKNTSEHQSSAPKETSLDEFKNSEDKKSLETEEKENENCEEDTEECLTDGVCFECDKEQKSQLVKEIEQAQEVEERETESCDKEGQTTENLKNAGDTERFVDAEVQKSENVDKEQKSQLVKASGLAEEVEEREFESCDKEGQMTENLKATDDTEGFVDTGLQKSESFDKEQRSQLMTTSGQAEGVEEQKTESCDKEGQTTGNLKIADDTEGFADADVQKSENVDKGQKSQECDKETSETKEIKESKNLPKKESNDANLVEDLAEKQIEINDKSKGEEQSRLNAAVEETEEKEEKETEMTHEENQESELHEINQENILEVNKTSEISKQVLAENQMQESVHLKEVTVVQENESRYLQTSSSKKTKVSNTTYSIGQDIPEDGDKENESPARKKRRTSDDERKMLQRMNMVNYVDSFPESEDFEIIDLTEEAAPSSSVSGTSLLTGQVEQSLKDEPDGLSTDSQLQLQSEGEKDITSKSGIPVDLVERADPEEMIADDDSEPLRHQATGPIEGESSVLSVKAVTRKRKATDEASGQEKRFCERDMLMRDATFMKKLVAHFFSIRDRVKRRNYVDENCNIKNVPPNNTVIDVGIKTEVSNELATPSVYENLEGQIKVESKTEICIKRKEESTSDVLEQVISPKKEETCSGEEMTGTQDMKCLRKTLNDDDIIIISESDSEGVVTDDVRQDQEQIRLTCDESSLGSPENPERDGAGHEPNKKSASCDNHKVDNLHDSDEHQDEEMISDEHEKEDKNANEEMTDALQYSDKDANNMKSDETKANSPQSMSATSPEPSAEQTGEDEDDSTAPLDSAEVSDEEAARSDQYKSVQSPESSLNLALLSSDDYEVYTDENTPEFYSPAKGSSLKEVGSGSFDLKSEQSSSKVRSKMSGNDSSSSQTDRSNVSVHTLDSDYDSDVYITEYSPPSKSVVKTEYITSDDEDDMDSNSRSRSKQFSLKGNNSNRMTNPHQGTFSKFQTTPGKDDERSDKEAGDAIAERFEETTMKEIDEDIEQDDMATDPSTPVEKPLEEKDQPDQTLTADDLVDEEDKPGAAETAGSEESAGLDQNEASNMAQIKPSGSNKDTLSRSSTADSLVADFSEDTDSVCGPEVNVGDIIGMLEEEDRSLNLARSGSLEDIFQGNSEGKTDNTPLEKTDSLKDKQIKAAAEAIVEKELPEKKSKETKDSSSGAVICCSLGHMSPEDREDPALCSQAALEDPHEKVQNADESRACSDQDELETGSVIYPDVSQVYAGAPCEEEMAVMGSSVESGDTKEDFPQLSGRRKRTRRSSDSGSEVDSKRLCVDNAEKNDNSTMSTFLGVNDVDTNMDIGDEPPYSDDDSDSIMSMPVLEKEIELDIGSFKKSTDFPTDQQMPNQRIIPNSSSWKSVEVINDNSPKMKDLASEDPSRFHVQPSTSKADCPADSQTILDAMEDMTNTQISQLDRELTATDNPENKKHRTALDKLRARRKVSATFQKTEVPVPVPVTPGELPGPSSIQRNIFQSDAQQKVKKMKDCVTRCLNVTRLLEQAFQQNEELCNIETVKVWWDELIELSSNVQLPRTVIAVVGDTGSGKSSMLNALLHEPRVLPTSGVEACTAVVVEVSENSLNNKYEADIHFLSPEEWEDELKVLLKDLTKMNGELQKRQPDPQTDAGVAFAKVRAVYGKIDTMEALKKQMNITRWLGRVKHVSVATAKELRDKVNTYIESRDTGSKSGQFWPIVKRVELRLPSCDACSSGAILVDLPGVRDANAARDRIAREYLKNCTSVWVVAEIHRAKDNRTAKELLDENFRRQLLMDGQFSSVAFICTKTDSLIPSELKQLLALPSQFDELGDEVSRLGDEIRNLSEEKEEQEVEHKTLRSRFKSLQAGYDELDAEISEAREALLLEEDEEAAADIQEAERDLREKDQEMKETQAQMDRIVSDIDTLSKQITRATFKQEQIQRDIAVMCAKARNEHAKSQIKKGFRAGIRELKRRSSNLTEEEDIEDYDDGESDDDDDEEMSSIIHNLQVFCTSSADYQRMTKLLTDGDGDAKVFSTPEETQIPALREFVHSTTLKRREHGVKQMVERVGHFILNIDSYLKMSELGNKESRQTQPVVNKHLFVLKTKVEEIVVKLGEDIVDIYSSQIFGQLEAGSKVAAMKARPTSDKWGQKVNKTNRDQGGLYYQTYLAVVRRYGRFKSPTAGTIDFNEQLSDPLIKAMSLNWGKIFGAQILSCLDKVGKSMNSALENFSKDIRKDFSKGELDPLQIDHALKQIIRIANAKLAEMTELMKEYISTQQKEISRLVTPKIKESLAETYVAMTMETGPGSFGRMRKKMADSIDSECKMFDESASEIHGRLTMLKESVCKRVRGVLLALCSSFRISFLPLWQSASTFLNIKKHLAQSVSECLILIQQLYQDMGLMLPVMAEAPPELDTSLPIEPEETVDEVLGALRHDVEDQVKRLEAVSDEEEVIALPGQKLPAPGHTGLTGVKKEPEPYDEFSFSRHMQESGKTMLREVSVEGQVWFWNKSVTDALTPGTLQVIQQNGEWFCNFNSTASPARNKSFKVSSKLIKHLEQTKLQLIIELTNGLRLGCFSQDSQSLHQAHRLLRAIVDGTTDLVSREKPASVMRSMVTGKRVVVTGVEVSPDTSSTVPGSTSIRDILHTDSNSGSSTSHPTIHTHGSFVTAPRVPAPTSIRDNLQQNPESKASHQKIIVVNTPSLSNTDGTKPFAESVPTENQQDPAASSQCRSKMSTKVNLPEEPKPTYKSLISKQTKDSKSSIVPNRCPQYKHKLGRHSVGTFSAVTSQSSVSESSSGYQASCTSKTKVKSSVTPKKFPKSGATSPEKIVQKLLSSPETSSAKTVSSQSVKMPASSISQLSRPESLHAKDIGRKQRVTSRISQPDNKQSSSLSPFDKVERRSSKYFKLYQPETAKLNPPETTNETTEGMKRTQSAKATASATLGASLTQDNPSRISVMDTGRPSLTPLRSCCTQNQTSTKIQTSATFTPSEPPPDSSHKKRKHGKSLSLKSLKRPAPVVVKQEPLEEVVVQKRSRLEDDEVVILSDSDNDLEDTSSNPSNNTDNNPVASYYSNIKPGTSKNRFINLGTSGKSSSKPVASGHNYSNQEIYKDGQEGQESEDSDGSSSDDDLPSFL